MFDFSPRAASFCFSSAIASGVAAAPRPVAAAGGPPVAPEGAGLRPAAAARRDHVGEFVPGGLDGVEDVVGVGRLTRAEGPRRAVYGTRAPNGRRRIPVPVVRRRSTSAASWQRKRRRETRGGWFALASSLNGRIVEGIRHPVKENHQAPHPTWIRGRRIGLGSDCRRTSRVTGAVSPSPNARNFNR